MAQPQAFNRETDFTERDGDDTNHAAINSEFDAAALSINEIRDNLALIQRDDGALQNGIVTAESLAQSAYDAIAADVNAAVQDAQTAAASSTLAANTSIAARDAALAAQTAAETSQSASALNASTATTKAAEAAASAAEAGENATAAINEVYYGDLASDPTLDPNGDPVGVGDLYFNTVANELRVYTGSLWKAAGSSVNGTNNRATYTATAGQTTFGITYDTGFVDVYLNGVKLVAGSEFTANTGTNIVLATGATAGDTVDIVAYGSFELASVYNKTEVDAALALKADASAVSSALALKLNAANPSYSGTLTGGTGVVNLGSGQFYKDASGNVGIGTSSPGSSGLTVYRAGSSAISLNNAATGTAAASGFQSQIGSSGEAYIWNYSNSFIAIGTNNTERFRIDSSGRVTMPYQPAFLAYPSATSVSVPSGVSTISGAFTAPVNIGSHFNTSTRRFTAPISGSYFFSACVATIGSTGTFDYLSSEIWVNGSRRIQGGWDGGGASYGKSSVSGVIYLNANEYVELACEASKAFSAQGGSAATIFSGYLIG